MTETIDGWVADGASLVMGGGGVRRVVAAWGVPYLPARTALGSDLLAGSPRPRIRACPFTAVIPGFMVCAVVPEPWGAHPFPLPGRALRDDAF